MQQQSNDPARPADPAGRSRAGRIDHFMSHAVQWTVTASAAIGGVLILSDINHAALPGGSPPLLYASLGLCVVCLIVLMPPLFFRLPPAGRMAAYGVLLALVILANKENNVQSAAYARTPTGAKEAAADAERIRAENAEQAERDRIDQQFAHAAETERQLAEYKNKAEACFSWGHRLPALETPVKDSLENPHAFEHVRTELIDPDSDHNNVMMVFRAQNGFGAIRTVHVLAQLIPDDCSVQNIGRPQDD